MSLYSSFFIFHFSKLNGIKVDVTNMIGRISERIMNFSNSHALLNNAWIYMIVILVFPFQTFIPSLLYDNVIIHSLDKITKYLF